MIWEGNKVSDFNGLCDYIEEAFANIKYIDGPRDNKVYVHFESHYIVITRNHVSVYSLEAEDTWSTVPLTEGVDIAIVVEYALKVFRSHVDGTIKRMESLIRSLDDSQV